MKLKPTAVYPRLTDVPADFLSREGIRLVCADLDNTLAPWRTTDVLSGAREWCAQAQQAGIKVFLVTNGKKENADRVAEELGIGLYKGAMKPFRKKLKLLLRQEGVSAQETLFIGDQLFTDIQAAGALGAKSVLTQPLEKREWWCTKVFNRTREKLVWPFLFRK